MSVYVATRDVIAVAGEDAENYLQGQISQDVLALGVGESAWSLILQPQGKVDAWFRITRRAQDSFLLDVDAGFGEQLLARLQRFLLRTKAELSLETWDWHAYDTALSDSAVEGRAQIVAPSPTGRGVDLIGPEMDAPSAPASQNLDEYELLRITAGVPKMGAELDESTIPAEARIVERSVSFTKGCYTGQELVARVDSRGDNTPRKLRVVTGPGLPDVGALLHLDDAEAGVLTSVAPDGDDFAALAYVKRSALDATTLDLGGVAVTVAAVPGDTPTEAH